MSSGQICEQTVLERETELFIETQTIQTPTIQTPPLTIQDAMRLAQPVRSVTSTCSQCDNTTPWGSSLFCPNCGYYPQLKKFIPIEQRQSSQPEEEALISVWEVWKSVPPWAWPMVITIPVMAIVDITLAVWLRETAIPSELGILQVIAGLLIFAPTHFFAFINNVAKSYDLKPLDVFLNPKLIWAKMIADLPHISGPVNRAAISLAAIAFGVLFLGAINLESLLDNPPVKKKPKMSLLSMVTQAKIPQSSDMTMAEALGEFGDKAAGDLEGGGGGNSNGDFGDIQESVSSGQGAGMGVGEEIGSGESAQTGSDQADAGSGHNGGNASSQDSTGMAADAASGEASNPPSNGQSESTNADGDTAQQQAGSKASLSGLVSGLVNKPEKPERIYDLEAPQNTEQARCVIIGFNLNMQQHVASLLVAELQHGQWQYTGTLDNVQLNAEQEERFKLAARQYLRKRQVVPAPGQAFWMTPGLECLITFEGRTPSKRLIRPKLDQLLFSVDARDVQ